MRNSFGGTNKAVSREHFKYNLMCVTVRTFVNGS